MTTPTQNDLTDNYEWLTAIDEHPDLTPEDLVGAYAIIGVDTNLDEHQVFWAGYRLETEGFLRAEVLKRTLLQWLSRKWAVSYTLSMPPGVRM